MEHLRSDVVEDYAFRRLPEAQAARAEEHLLVCGFCRTQLDDFEVLRSAIADAFSHEFQAGGKEGKLCVAGSHC